jgi:hypothetical protein
LKKSPPILKTTFDRRVLIALGLFFNLAGYFLIPEIFGLSRQKLFHFAGVATLEVPFMDLRGVATWCEAAACGIDPAVTHTTLTLTNGTKQPNFLMNYSPSVLLLCGRESLRNPIFKEAVMWVVFVVISLLCGAPLARVPDFLQKGEVS